MTMRVTVLATVMGEAGSLLTTGANPHTVSKAFGADLVGSGRATDTDGVLGQKPSPSAATVHTSATASRVIGPGDVDNVVSANHASVAIVLTVPVDTALGTANAECVSCYQVGAAAASFTAGAGVTIRGTAPTPAQYLITGLMRVGANEWAYL